MNKLIILSFSSLLLFSCRSSEGDTAFQDGSDEFFVEDQDLSAFGRKAAEAKPALDAKSSGDCSSQLSCGISEICFDVTSVRAGTEQVSCQETSTCDSDSDCGTGAVCTEANVCLGEKVKVQDMKHLRIASKLMMTDLCESDDDCTDEERPICKIKKGETKGRCVKDNTSEDALDPVVLIKF